MRLRSKILLGYTLTLILAVTLVTVAVYYLFTLGNFLGTAMSDTEISAKTAESIVDDLTLLNERNILLLQAATNSDTSGNSIAHQEITDIHKRILEKIASCEQAAQTGRELNSARELRRRYMNYSGMTMNDSIPVTSQTYYAAALPQLRLAISQAFDYAEQNRGEIVARETELRSAYKTAFAIMAGLGLTFLIVTFITSVRLPQKVTGPLDVIAGKMSKLADGEYKQKLQVQNRALPEIANIAHGFNRLTDRLSALDREGLPELITQKSRMEAIFRSLNDAIIVLDEQRTIILANKAASRVLGIGEQNLIGKLASEIAVYNKLMDEVLKVLYNEREEDEQLIQQVQIEGKEETFASEIVLVYDERDLSYKRFLGYVIHLKNITQYRTKTAPVERSTAMQNLSRDLHTPLSNIHLNLSSFQNENIEKLSPEQQKLLAAAREENERLLQMISGVIDLWSTESESIVYDFQTVDPETIIFNSLQPLAEEMYSRNILLFTEIDSGLPNIKADPERISWTIINIFRKAIQRTPERGTVKVQVAHQDAMVSFCIEDSGPAVFKNTRASEPGLIPLHLSQMESDLSLVKDIITAHKGKVWASSRNEGGNQVCFTLPVA